VAFGVFVPIFFVVSGMSFDIDSFVDEPITLLRVPLYLALFLVIRGVPVLLFYRRDLPRWDLAPLALLSATALPLVVAITQIGLDTHRMKSENAAALVGAAMLSVLIFPYVAFALRRRHPVSEEPAIPAPPDEPDTVYEDEADV
jgi:Kef-type K+ transport system membrane component KefB